VRHGENPGAYAINSHGRQIAAQLASSLPIEEKVRNRREEQFTQAVPLSLNSDPASISTALLCSHIIKALLFIICKSKECHAVSNSNEPLREHPSTYFVQDRSNIDETTRLRVQDQMLTTMMGGVLSEQSDPGRFQSVLDVGCGTGGWLIEAAKTYPHIKRLVGVDISDKMLAYARAQAEEQGVSDRVEFQAMDALRMLEFPENSFDLVNQRYALSWLRKWDWPKVLSEYQRVCKTNGVVRITECALITESSSPAYLEFNQLLVQAFHQAGNFFTDSHDGIISQIARLLEQHGCQHVQTRAYRLEYQASTPEWHHFYEDNRLIFRTLQPFLRKWTRVPEDYEERYQQMLDELQQPDFVAIWPLLTVWGVSR
jgi:ubiquinone/menaquinone biosynthesis C-methylase UbiE